jgi:HSP20 family molecular chaperone IbpA
MPARYLTAALTVLCLLLPPGAQAWTPYGAAPPPYTGGAALRIERQLDARGYHLTIHVTGLEPRDLSVTVEDGRWLAIRGTTREEQETRQTAPDGSRFGHSFEYRNVRVSRRIALPPDADTSALEREDQPGAVRITLPRRP